MNPFNLALAQKGEPIQTVEGRERRFIAYLPDRRPHLRVVVLDPKSDRIYSHSENGEHCESVGSLRLVMKPVQKTIYWLGAYQTKINSEWCVTSNAYTKESDALFRAEIAVETGHYKNPRAIRIEL